MFFWWYCSIDMKSPSYTVEYSQPRLRCCLMFSVRNLCKLQRKRGLLGPSLLHLCSSTNGAILTNHSHTLLSKIHVPTLLVLVEITQDLLFHRLSRCRGLTRWCLKINKEKDPTKAKFFGQLILLYLLWFGVPIISISWFRSFCLVPFHMYTFLG